MAASTGVIKGNPTLAGEYPFTANVTDASGYTASLPLTLDVAGVISGGGQHPHLWLDSDELTFIRQKVASDSADWQALKQQCDVLAAVPNDGIVSRPNAVDNGDSGTRPKVINAGGGPYLYTGFGGSMWDQYLEQLGVCYQALKPTDPATANTYLLIAHYIIQAAGQPFLTMTRRSDGLVRYPVSTYANGNDLLAGSPPQVLLVYNYAPSSAPVSVGDIWTVSGALGCTSLNNTWQVSQINGSTIYFSNPSGAAAAPLNANCTLYSVAFGDYASRFYMPALAKAYDWFYDGLAASYPADLTNLQAALTAWGTELSYCPTHQTNANEDNYAHSYLWALAAEYIAVNSDLPGLGTLVNDTLATKLYAMRDYRERWFAGGGAGEGWQAYGYGSIRRMLNAELAMKIAG
jgi:hypothetical protein